MQKVGIPLVGLKWQELVYSATHKYEFGLSSAVIEFIEKCKTDKSLFEQVVENGIFHAMYQNQSESFKKAWKEVGTFFPWFDPAFFNERGFNSEHKFIVHDEWKEISDFMIRLKELPEKLPKNYNIEYFKFDEEEMGWNISGDDPNTNVGIHSFKENEEENYIKFTATVGMNNEHPYKLFDMQCLVKFDKLSRNVTIVFEKFKQFRHAADFEKDIWPGVQERVLAMLMSFFFLGKFEKMWNSTKNWFDRIIFCGGGSRKK